MVLFFLELDSILTPRVQSAVLPVSVGSSDATSSSPTPGPVRVRGFKLETFRDKPEGTSRRMNIQPHWS